MSYKKRKPKTEVDSLRNIFPGQKKDNNSYREYGSKDNDRVQLLEECIEKLLYVFDEYHSKCKINNPNKCWVCDHGKWLIENGFLIDE